MRILALGEIGADGTTIDKVRYSRYKYGQVEAVEAFAAELARAAVAHSPEFADAPTTVTAPASRTVPIGADMLADGVLRHLNHARTAQLREPAVRAKLQRFEVPSGDYGSEDLETRKALLAAERISSIPELFTDRHVIVVDDLWVTGTSAEVTAAAVERWRPASLTYLVIATVQPHLADLYPEVEHELNHAAVNSLPALAELTRDGSVVVNQRVCKFVLSHPASVVEAWLPGLAPQFVWQLYSAVLAEGFGLMPEYRETVAVITERVDTDGLQEWAIAYGWTPV
jgi:predicted phosphoribosyltransferase